MFSVVGEPVRRQSRLVRLGRVLGRVELLLPVRHGLAIGRQALDVPADERLREQCIEKHIINKDQPLTGGKLRSAEVSVVAAAQRGRWAP